MEQLLAQLNDFLNFGWDIGEWTFTVRMILYIVLLAIASYVTVRFVAGRLLSFLESKGTLEADTKKYIRELLWWLVGFGSVAALLQIMFGVDYVIVQSGEWVLDVRKILKVILVALIAYLTLHFVADWLLSFLKSNNTLDEQSQKRIRSLLVWMVGFGSIAALLNALDIDYVIYTVDKKLGIGEVHFRISLICYALITFKVAQLLDWIIARTLVEKYFDSREEREKAAEAAAKKRENQPQKDSTRSNANKTIQYVVYTIAIIYILRSFGLDYEFYEFEDSKGIFSISTILSAALTILIARLIIWILTNLVLYSYYRRSRVDVGSQYAINQLLAYVIYVGAAIHAMGLLGFKLDILLGGAAALLVGVGLGLQQTFNDLISGIILLFERTVEVDDVVEVSGIVGTVTSIGIRTSVVRVLDNTSIVVPNSKFITENVVNWSHYDDKVRFNIPVGIAYGSDTERVREILLTVAQENPYVLNRPAPLVRFMDFGDSALHFQLHFWSRDFTKMDDIKSDMRFRIDHEFRKENVEIPFPQRDIWVRQSPPPPPSQ